MFLDHQFSIFVKILTASLSRLWYLKTLFFSFFEDSVCEGINFDCSDEVNDCFRFWVRLRGHFRTPAWQWNFASRFSHSSLSACTISDGTTFPISPQIADRHCYGNKQFWHLNFLAYFNWWCLIEAKGDGLHELNVFALELVRLCKWR